MLPRMWKNWTSPTQLFFHFRKQSDDLLKVKDASTMWSSDSTPVHLSKRNESLCPYNDLFTHIYHRFICNRQKLERIQMFSNRCMNFKKKKKKPPRYTHVLSSNKKIWTIIDAHTTWMTLKIITLSERLLTHSTYFLLCFI